MNGRRRRFRGGHGGSRSVGSDTVDNTGRKDRIASEKTIRIALAGNPNAGKTSLFNAITGQHQHIGNYPGVTVDKKTGYVEHKGWVIELIDLPGTYSLTAYSREEIVTRDFVLQEKPDLIVDVIDSTNLERNLYLCLQFQELGVPVIGALNMSDEMRQKGLLVDHQQLGTILGIPFIKTVGTNGTGKSDLLDLIVSYAENLPTVQQRRVNYGRELEGEREKLRKVIGSDPDFAEKYDIDWVAIKLLEDDADAEKKIKGEHKTPSLVLKRAEQSRDIISRHFNEDSVVVVSEQRYAYIHGAVHETVKRIRAKNRINFTEQIDKIVLHRYSGVFIFLLIMFLTYQITFSIGNPLSDLIDSGFASLGELMKDVLPKGVLLDLIVDGIIGGVGGVLVFFPIVVLLFLGLSFLEDSGYMARAAFVMDKFFHVFGMHGRSFIPFMIATGCAVPAIMSTRTLVNERDRIITILVTPFMMCGAKAPVVAMLTAAFFPHKAVLVFWLVWIFGWLIAFIIAWIFRKTLFRGEAAPFVMELPPYRLPTVRGIFTHMWDKSYAYVRKAGTIILAASIVIWFLLYFPKPTTYSFDYDGRIAELEAVSSPNAESEVLPDNSRQPTRMKEIERLESAKAEEEIRHSYAGRAGILLEPILKPAGFDWRIGVGLFGGLIAKEVIISTMGIVYGIGEASPDLEGSRTSGSPLKTMLARDTAYSPAMALALMLFVLMYVPCSATLAVVKKETGTWKWPVFQAFYTLFLAWGLAVLVYQIAHFAGL